MSIYDPLRHFLGKSAVPELKLTFLQLEKILGRKLPASAYRRAEFWTNNTTGHSHAQAWRSVGWKTRDVEVEKKRLVFFRERYRLQDRLKHLAVFRRSGSARTSVDVVASIREDRDR